MIIQSTCAIIMNFYNHYYCDYYVMVLLWSFTLGLQCFHADLGDLINDYNHRHDYLFVCASKHFFNSLQSIHNILIAL